MERVNPVVIPRNTYVDEAIEDALRGDVDRLKELIYVLRRPYDENVSSHWTEVPDQSEPYVAFCGT